MNIPADVSTSLEAILLMEHSMATWAAILSVVGLLLFVLALMVASAREARIYAFAIAAVSLGIFAWAMSIEQASRDDLNKSIRPHCDKVLAAISDGRLRYLENAAVSKLESTCGKESVRDAANASTSRFLSRSED